MRKKLYLANPYGFSKQTKTLLHEFIEIFNDLNVEVFEPFERAKPLTQKESEWAYDVARSNFHDLKECDCIFAIVNGNPPDEGVMFFVLFSKVKPKWWNTVFISKKSQWIVFPWENTLNSKSEREEYIKKRGLI